MAREAGGQPPWAATSMRRAGRHRRRVRVAGVAPRGHTAPGTPSVATIRMCVRLARDSTPGRCWRPFGPPRVPHDPAGQRSVLAPGARRRRGAGSRGVLRSP